ncbi:ATP-binding protein [Saccharothrix syringae]|uniref:Tetratricopeptide repeat protein n=1 Tax=Saccharothrix syringae TaxID=103733 RepID=A0A5Q0GTJ5_SACSY|nr:tetratricopeptide repeat protein [Saccharothrix syringae]QFZ17377.1 tetratricopeptide repeat protein [Saccharothrix syringae]
MTGEPTGGGGNEVTGRINSVVQAGAIHGDVHMGHAAAGVALPRQLPNAPARFVNREEQLATLDALLLESSPPMTSVTGAPGTGKSTLALHWAHRVRRRFRDGDLYLDLRGYGPGLALTPRQGVEFFLHALGVPPERIPADPELSASLYRSVLDGKRVLVVIDNAASAAQVRPLLPAAPECFTVITSRSRLSSLIVTEGAGPIVLDVLTPDESVEVLRRLIGAERVDREPGPAARIALRCGYLPLALRIVAERLTDEVYLPLAELADELDDEYRRLDALTSRNDELADVRAVFSWSYHRLSPVAARAFRLLGLHAGTDIGTAAAAALTDHDSRSARRALGSLTDSHLVQQVAAERFRLHDLVRLYAAERADAEETAGERRRAVRRVTRWYLLSAANARRSFLPDLSLGAADLPDGDDPVEPLSFSGAEEALAWFEVERFTLLAVLEQALTSNHLDLAAVMPRAVAGFYEVRAYWSDYRQVYATGVRASREINSRPWVVANLIGLGDADGFLGNVDGALASYHEAVALSRAAGDSRNEGFALRGIGLIHQDAGRFDLAAEHHRRALAALRRVGARRGEGMCLLSLGDCHRALERFGEAFDHGLRALEIFRSTRDRLAEARALNSLGTSRRAEGRLPEALEHHREALAVFRRFDHPYEEASTLLDLGDVLDGLGRSTEARDHWLAARVIFERIGAPEVDSANSRLTTD